MAKAKEIEGLNCDGNAAGEIRLVLSERLEEMCQLRAAALEWSDIEGVHDMRVASRRLRSALRDFKPYLRQRKLSSVARELKRIADALGAVRDEDVAIMALEELQIEAPSEVAAGIVALTDERRNGREAERASLAKTIAPNELAGLQKEFTVATERATEPRRQKKKRSAAESSFREVGREIILARLAELRDLSGCLYQPFKVVPLHDMRIASKRLRYAMELFVACQGAELSNHAEQIAELQKSLGELHDCDVWLEGFGRMLRDLRKREEAGAPLTETDEQKRYAAVWLMRHFAKARMKHFGNALSRWHGWETGGFFAELVACLEAPPPAVELSPIALTATEAVADDIEAEKAS